MDHRNKKDRPWKEGIAEKKLASEAYRALGGVARTSAANRAIVGHHKDLVYLPSFLTGQECGKAVSNQ